MSESLSSWLALRERVDHASRSLSLTQTVAAALPAVRPLRIVDLGSGTGSNIRFLSPLLPSPQHWVTVDRDSALLEESKNAGVAIERRVMNLGRFDSGLLAGAALVTASALLDLVSDRWLNELASACRAADAAVLFALTYNGRSECTPRDRDDARVLELFNTHQRRSDKGFGAAAGPDAVALTVAAFRRVGYQVRCEPSDWVLTPDMQALQLELIDGWVSASTEIAPSSEASVIDDWRSRRRGYVTSGRSTIVVGHDDICGTLDDMTSAAR